MLPGSRHMHLQPLLTSTLVALLPQAIPEKGSSSLPTHGSASHLQLQHSQWLSLSLGASNPLKEMAYLASNSLPLKDTVQHKPVLKNMNNTLEATGTIQVPKIIYILMHFTEMDPIGVRKRLSCQLSNDF